MQIPGKYVDRQQDLTSLAEKLQASQTLHTSVFLERITKMADAPDGYLHSNRIVLWTRG